MPVYSIFFKFISKIGHYGFSFFQKINVLYLKADFISIFLTCQMSSYKYDIVGNKKQKRSSFHETKIGIKLALFYRFLSQKWFQLIFCFFFGIFCDLVSRSKSYGFWLTFHRKWGLLWFSGSSPEYLGDLIGLGDSGNVIGKPLLLGFLRFAWYLWLFSDILTLQDGQNPPPPP